MATQQIDNGGNEHQELPVEELLRRARPLPPHEEMALEDLTDDEADAFLSAVNT